MIWNTASKVIYNGSLVNSVYCNGIKIWPSAKPTPIYSWSASGYNSVATSTKNYGLIQPLNVSKFTWLTTATTSVSSILNNKAYFQKIGNNAGTSASSVQRGGLSSFNQSTKLFNFWLTIRVTGKAESSNYQDIYSAQLNIPKILYDYSGIGHTATINGVNASSYTRYGFTTEITGSATITANSARLVLQQGTISTPNIVSAYGPSVFNRHSTAYMQVGMSSYWTASGVYRP